MEAKKIAPNLHAQIGGKMLGIDGVYSYISKQYHELKSKNTGTKGLWISIVHKTYTELQLQNYYQTFCHSFEEGLSLFSKDVAEYQKVLHPKHNTLSHHETEENGEFEYLQEKTLADALSRQKDFDKELELLIREDV